MRPPLTSERNDAMLSGSADKGRDRSGNAQCRNCGRYLTACHSRSRSATLADPAGSRAPDTPAFANDSVFAQHMLIPDCAYPCMMIMIDEVWPLGPCRFQALAPIAE